MTPVQSFQRSQFIKLLSESAFISIDGCMYRITAYEPYDYKTRTGGELFYYDEYTGDEYVSTWTELFKLDNIRLYQLHCGFKRGE